MENPDPPAAAEHRAPAVRCSLDAVLITHELVSRPSRSRDLAAENAALVLLAEAMANTPLSVTQLLVDLARQLVRADCTGISSFETADDGRDVLQWTAISEPLVVPRSGSIDRDASPCGLVLARNETLLFRDLARHFPALSEFCPQMSECLLVPFHEGTEPTGTLWAIKHAPAGGFDAEDARLLQNLARFASASHRMTEGLQHAERRRAGSERRFSTFIENVRDYAIFTVNGDGIVTEWSEGAHSVLGYTAGEVLGRHFSIFFPSEAVAAGEPQAELEQALSEGRAERESWRLHRNGQRIWVNAISTAIRDESGKLAGFTKIARDLTARKRAEEELRTARESAERANRSKSRFLATASHDLRQPLQALSLLNGTLQRAAIGEAAREVIEEQQQAIVAISGLLNALLNISKLESGTVKPQIADFEVDSILAAMRSEFTTIAATIGLRFTATGCDVVVRSDPTLLGQILRNLIGNALRYTTAGRVDLRCRADGSMVHIEVADTGIGIPEELLPNIFEEFFQVGISANATREGHGLGLSIVKHTAQLLGIEVRVRSKVGVGSTFELVVPAGMLAKSEAAAPAASQTSTPVRLPRILVVDDHPAVLKATRLLLQIEGYPVSTATSLGEARDIARTHGDIEVVVTDYHLAGQELGTHVIQELRAQLGPALLAILVSGDTSPAMNQIARDAAARIISKPIDSDQLLGLMKAMLES